MNQTQELTFNNYPFLKELGLTEDNAGCYRNGEWVGSGATVTAVNPANNKPIARVRLASLKDYHESVAAMLTEQKRWAAMPAPLRGEVVR